MNAYHPQPSNFKIVAFFVTAFIMLLMIFSWAASQCPPGFVPAAPEGFRTYTDPRYRVGMNRELRLDIAKHALGGLLANPRREGSPIDFARDALMYADLVIDQIDKPFKLYEPINATPAPETPLEPTPETPQEEPEPTPAEGFESSGDKST